jgi:hypothetical protein
VPLCSCGKRSGILGLLKELSDARNPNEMASVLDLVWDAGGVAFATAIVARVK